MFHLRVINRASDKRTETVSGATFEAFFETEHRRLFRSLVLITGDRQEAEDVAQEAMIRIFERWDRVAGMEEPSGYLFRTALNLNRNRHRWRARRTGGVSVDREALSDTTDHLAEIVDIKRALADLTFEQRVAVVLVDYLGFDATSAGRVLGIEAEAIRARLHRGRSALRERLTQDG